MLVLSRKNGESIVVGDGSERIEFTIVQIRGDKVRVGITAPKAVPVHRSEVHSAIVSAGEDVLEKRQRQIEAELTKGKAVAAEKGAT